MYCAIFPIFGFVDNQIFDRRSSWNVMICSTLISDQLWSKSSWLNHDPLDLSKPFWLVCNVGITLIRSQSESSWLHQNLNRCDWITIWTIVIGSRSEQLWLDHDLNSCDWITIWTVVIGSRSESSWLEEDSIVIYMIILIGLLRWTGNIWIRLLQPWIHLKYDCTVASFLFKNWILSTCCSNATYTAMIDSWSLFFFSLTHINIQIYSSSCPSQVLKCI